eukprot:403352877
MKQYNQENKGRSNVKKQSKFLKMQIVQHYQKEKAIINKIRNRITRDRKFDYDDLQEEEIGLQNQGFSQHVKGNLNVNSKLKHNNTSLLSKLDKPLEQLSFSSRLERSQQPRELQLPSPHKYQDKNTLNLSTDQINNHRHYYDKSKFSSSKTQKHQNSQTNTQQLFGCPAIYKLGEFKEYRKQIGQELFKNNKKTMMLNEDNYMSGGMKVFDKMEIFKGLDAEASENQAINETLRQVIDDLKKRIKKYEQQNLLQEQQQQKFKSALKSNRYGTHSPLNQTKPGTGNRLVFLPKIAKQKVIDQFISLSTADVFNNPKLQNIYKFQQSNAISPRDIIQQNASLTQRYRESQYQSSQHNNSVNIGMIPQLDEYMLMSRGQERAKLDYLNNLTLQQQPQFINQTIDSSVAAHQQTNASTQINNTFNNQNNTINYGQGSVSIRKYNKSPININFAQFQKLKEDYTLRYRENQDDNQKLNKSLELGGAMLKQKLKNNDPELLQSIYHYSGLRGDDQQNSSNLQHERVETRNNKYQEVMNENLRTSQIQKSINNSTSIEIQNNQSKDMIGKGLAQNSIENHNHSQNQRNNLKTNIYQSLNISDNEQQQHQQLDTSIELKQTAKKPKKKLSKKTKQLSERMKQLLEERKKIQEQMRNNYYWNNFTMKKDDANEELDENGQKLQMSASQQELQRNMKILQKYQRFPLTDIYREKKQFIREMRQKYGSTKIDGLVAQQIDEYKFKNQVQMASELLKLHGLSQYDYE